MTFTIERLEPVPGPHLNSPKRLRWRECDRVNAGTAEAALLVAAETIGAECVLRVSGVSFTSREP